MTKLEEVLEMLKRRVDHAAKKHADAAYGLGGYDGFTQQLLGSKIEAEQALRDAETINERSANG